MVKGGLDSLRAKRADILRAAESRGARNLRVFGSFARGEAGPDSDVDLIVEPAEGRDFVDLGALLMDLQDVLGRRVHIVTSRSLYPYVRERVLAEAVPL